MEALAQNTYTMEKPLRERVIEILKELEMNKAELALRMNFSRSAVSQYLNGKYNSNPEALEEKLTEFVKEYEEHVKSETGEVKAIGRTVSGVKPKIAYRRLVSVNPVRRIWHLESLLQNQDTERHMP